MSTLLQDFRYAWRQLYKNRGVSLTAILSLTLGIGATVSVFSIIYAVLLNPWPYQGADRIASVALLDKWATRRRGGEVQHIILSRLLSSDRHRQGC